MEISGGGGGVEIFEGGLRNFRGVEKFWGGVEKSSGGLRNFRGGGVEKFSGGGGVEKFSGGGVEKFSGGIEKFSGGGVEKFFFLGGGWEILGGIIIISGVGG